MSDNYWILYCDPVIKLEDVYIARQKDSAMQITPPSNVQSLFICASQFINIIEICYCNLYNPCPRTCSNFCLFFNTSQTSFPLLHPPRPHPSESLLLFSLQKRADLPEISQIFITICNKTRHNRSYQGWERQPSGIKSVPGAGKKSEIPSFPP